MLENNKRQIARYIFIRNIFTIALGLYLVYLLNIIDREQRQFKENKQIIEVFDISSVSGHLLLFLFTLLFLTSLVFLCMYKDTLNDPERAIGMCSCAILIKFIIFFIFLMNVGFSQLYGEIIYDSLSESNCATGRFKDVNDTFLELKEIWCKSKLIESDQGTDEVGCGCFINDFTIWSEEDQILLKNTKEYSNIKPSKLSGALTVEECPFYNRLIIRNKFEIDLLKYLENKYECSGFCERDIIYHFQDVSKSIPKSKHGCFHFLNQKIYDLRNMLQTFTKIFFYSFVIDIPIIISNSFNLFFVFKPYFNFKISIILLHHERKTLSENMNYLIKYLLNS